jgi:hypothetical protein
MKKQLAFLSAAAIAAALPAWASARPHHAHRAALSRTAAAPAALRLQPIAFNPSDNRDRSSFQFTRDDIARDRIPTRAVNHFGDGGAASIGYQPGSTRSLIGAHELNAAFSSQPTAFGGVVGGGVSLQF